MSRTRGSRKWEFRSKDTCTPHSSIFSLSCKIKPPGRRLGIRALRRTRHQSWPRKSPPQHHEVEFGLTHKANSSYTPSPKKKFLSTQQAMEFAHWRINPRLVRAIIDKSGDTIRWLEEKGLEFDCIQYFHYPGQQVGYQRPISSSSEGTQSVMRLIPAALPAKMMLHLLR